MEMEPKFEYTPGEFLTDAQWAQKRAALIKMGLIHGMARMGDKPDMPPSDILDYIVQGHTCDEAFEWADAMALEGDKLKMEWISTMDRPPTKDDADQYGCVLAWDVNNGARTAGYQQVRPGSTLSHWQRLPGKPRELEHSIDADLPKEVQKHKLAEICARCTHAALSANQALDALPGCRDCIITCAHRLVCTLFEDKDDDDT